MKLTISEYQAFFNTVDSKESIARKCRNGELNASKNENGNWIIDCPIPQEIYDARLEAIEKRKYANRLMREYRKVEKEITDLMTIVLDFQEQH